MNLKTTTATALIDEAEGIVGDLPCGDCHPMEQCAACTRLDAILAELKERASREAWRHPVPKILVQDDDEHWYLIPEDKQDAWCLLDGNIDNADPFPDWIMPVDSPRSVKIVAYLPLG